MNADTKTLIFRALVGMRYDGVWNGFTFEFSDPYKELDYEYNREEELFRATWIASASCAYGTSSGVARCDFYDSPTIELGARERFDFFRQSYPKRYYKEFVEFLGKLKYDNVLDSLPDFIKRCVSSPPRQLEIDFNPKPPRRNFANYN